MDESNMQAREDGRSTVASQDAGSPLNEQNDQSDAAAQDTAAVKSASSPSAYASSNWGASASSFSARWMACLCRWASSARLRAARHSTQAIIVAGVAEAFAGALSMGAGEFIAGRSEAQVQRSEIEKERQEIERDPEFEKAEMRALLENEGMSAVDAAQVTETLARYPDAYHKTMVEKELGLQVDPQTVKTPEALTMSASYLVGSFFPLIAVLLPAAGAAGAGCLDPADHPCSDHRRRDQGAAGESQPLPQLARGRRGGDGLRARWLSARRRHPASLRLLVAEIMQALARYAPERSSRELLSRRCCVCCAG